VRGARSGGAGSSRAVPGPRLVPVFGLPFTDESLEGAARHLVDCALTQVRRRVVFVNAHSLNVSVRDRGLRQALDGADVVYADGVGMALAARMQGERLGHNVNGTDLFPHLCDEAAARGVPIALLGAAPGVAEACARRLRRAHPGLEIAYLHHGFLGPGDSARVIEQVNRSGAGILLVAMGVPRQECWITAHAPELTVPVVLGVGGLFDFISGRVPRAPRAVRRLRLEWLFRLMMEPRRLFGRYVLGNPAFLARALRYALTGRPKPASRETAAR
jgi:exopolysaccharide biosynthesis WecB/TagA/CpsF family protein